MHDVEFPQDYLDRLIRRRGRLHVYDRIDPGTTALIVVDLQNAFVAEGAPYECPAARGIVPNVNRLAATMRAAGGEIVWLLSTQPPREDPRFWSVFFDNFESDARREECVAALTEGNPGHAFYPELDVRPSETVIRKYRFSALIPGSSDLDRHLRARGVDTLLITGAATNGCCESTARDAAMMNYRVIMLSDATAAFDDANHLNGLWTVFQAFGDVRTTAETVAMIEDGAARRPAAGSG